MIPEQIPGAMSLAITSKGYLNSRIVMDIAGTKFIMLATK